MEEFIFGTLATDTLKLIYHRANQNGIQHAYNLNPRAPRPGEPVTVTVKTGPKILTDHVSCYYTLDGSTPEGHHGKAKNGEVTQLQAVSRDWDTLVWGYITTWEGTLPPQPEGTAVHYHIGAWTEGSNEIFADWPDIKITIEDAATAFFHNDPIPENDLGGNPTRPKTFLYQVTHAAPAQWAREAVIYQIFVDRFHPGKGKEWLQTEDLRDYFGGTLWGVIEKLDYIAELGANCIWLSPIFTSNTYHRYDPIDFYEVEPMLGGNEALRALIEAAHERGIHILLDLVCNHTSDQHEIFQDALNNPESPYRRWFHFDDSEIGYRAFFGVRTMPELNLNHPDARQWMLDIARFWLREYNIDGYRLDHAHGPGPGFWVDFQVACKEERPDCFCFGEVVEPPDTQLQYIGRLDGLLDFHLADAMRRTYGHKTHTVEQFNQFLEQHRQFFPDNFIMPTFLDNHDMDRFLFIAGDDKTALRHAAALQMGYPGPPIIYCGTEIGISQNKSKHGGEVGLEASRLPMVWDDRQDKELLAYYQQIIKQRFDTKPWE